MGTLETRINPALTKGYARLREFLNNTDVIAALGLGDTEFAGFYRHGEFVLEKNAAAVISVAPENGSLAHVGTLENAMENATSDTLNLVPLTIKEGQRHLTIPSGVLDTIDVASLIDRVTINYHLMRRHEYPFAFNKIVSLGDAAPLLGKKKHDLMVMATESKGRALVVEGNKGHHAVSGYELNRLQKRPHGRGLMSMQEFSDHFYISQEVMNRLASLGILKTRKDTVHAEIPSQFYDFVFPKKNSERYQRVIELLKGIESEDFSKDSLPIQGIDRKFINGTAAIVPISSSIGQAAELSSLTDRVEILAAVSPSVPGAPSLASASVVKKEQPSITYKDFIRASKLPYFTLGEEYFLRGPSKTRHEDARWVRGINVRELADPALLHQFKVERGEKTVIILHPEDVERLQRVTLFETEVTVARKWDACGLAALYGDYSREEVSRMLAVRGMPVSIYNNNPRFIPGSVPLVALTDKQIEQAHPYVEKFGPLIEMRHIEEIFGGKVPLQDFRRLKYAADPIKRIDNIRLRDNRELFNTVQTVTYL